MIKFKFFFWRIIILSTTEWEQANLFKEKVKRAGITP